jgi:hypothetical protein
MPYITPALTADTNAKAPNIYDLLTNDIISSTCTADGKSQLRESMRPASQKVKENNNLTFPDYRQLEAITGEYDGINAGEISNGPCMPVTVDA